MYEYACDNFGNELKLFWAGGLRKIEGLKTWDTKVRRLTLGTQNLYLTWNPRQPAFEQAVVYKGPFIKAWGG